MSEAARELAKKERPKFTNIHVFDIMRYRLPLAGIVSILHRISGAIMFLALPFILYVFEKSITSEISFYHFKGIVEQPLVKLVLLAVIWAYMQHFCAGVRHLFMDMHMGLTKEDARNSASTVLVVATLLTLLVAYKMFGGA